ncbi:hypothetical protein [Frigoriglobus tundricola]|uniref:Uncharacterized protein n=1 Tax=Frigoriglobus tundricola TaxID=2774151 RepID=A0A6M5YTV8_9BACT|nr:hypothetical protein [Frigoriglobus tundricola]QJW97505.1 hypothetical protein FTUN_5079 [Frigoriglobus tundricola]
MSNAPRSRRSAQLSVECLEDRTTPTFVARAGGDININGVNVPAGGVSIAAADLFPNRLDPLGFFSEMQYVTGTGPGTESLVRIWDSQTGALLSSFDPFPGFQGGVNVAVGDVLGLGTQQIVVTAAANGPPIVAVFNTSGQALSAFFLAGNTTFTGGLNVAVGHVSGALVSSGFDDSNATDSAPEQIILGTASQASIVAVTDGYGNISSIFQAFPGFTGGVTLAAADIDPTSFDGTGTSASDVPNTSSYAEIIVGAASRMPAVAVYDVWTGSVVERSAFWAFAANSGAGVTLAAGPTADQNQAQIFVSLLGTSTVSVFNGSTDILQGSFNVYPSNYSAGINLVVGYFTPGGYDPTDEFSFDTQDLAVVAGDGSYQQQPRYFIGLPDSPAGFNGPDEFSFFL